MQAVCLGWSIMQGHNNIIIIYALQTFFAFYNFCVAVRSVTQRNPYHTHSIIHLFGLMFWATTLLVTTAILPSTPMPSTSSIYFGVPNILWYITLAFYCVNFIIATTLPLGPPLHYPSERIYSDKTLQNTTSKYEDNVCGVTGE